MKLYNPIKYNNITINDIFNKEFKLSINRENLRVKPIHSNSNLSEVSLQEWDNNELWWLPLVLNKSINPFALNIDTQKLYESIRHNIITNPFDYFKNDIVELCDILSRILESYVQDDTSVSAFMVSQIKSYLRDIRQKIDILPSKNQVSVTDYEIKSMKTHLYQDKFREVVLNYGVEYIKNLLPSNYINKPYVLHQIFETNNEFNFKVEYCGIIRNITHGVNDDMLLQIKDYFDAHYILKDKDYYFINNYLYSESPIKITVERSQTTMTSYNINQLVKMVNGMLYLIFDWSKNETIQ